MNREQRRRMAAELAKQTPRRFLKYRRGADRQIQLHPAARHRAESQAITHLRLTAEATDGR